MKRFGSLFAVATLGFTLAAMAQDYEPGTSFGNRRWSTDREFDIPTVGSSGMKPLYYRPTMRYYGNGYTVNYRYIPVYKQDSIYIGATGGSSNFRTEAFHMSPEDMTGWGATSPRLTVKDPRSSAPRTAVTSIVRKKTVTTRTSTKVSTDSAPLIVPAATPDSVSAPAKP